MDMMCGKCGKKYTTDEYLALLKVPAVATDTNPSEQHGFTGVCACGYTFHKDKWLKKTEVEVQKGKKFVQKAEVSSVFLEMNHGDVIGVEHEELWFETMIFPDEVFSYQKRYATQVQAEADHARIVGLLQKGKFKLNKHVSYTVSL